MTKRYSQYDRTKENDQTTNAELDKGDLFFHPFAAPVIAVIGFVFGYVDESSCEYGLVASVGFLSVWYFGRLLGNYTWFDVVALTALIGGMAVYNWEVAAFLSGAIVLIRVVNAFVLFLIDKIFA